MADVRVGIVSWNTAELLDRCLAALPSALGDLDAEVVVVDNASSDGSAERAAAHPGVEVVTNDTNRGYARAMNQALAGADAPVLVALNPDTEVPPGALAALVSRLLERPRSGVVVPRLVNADGSVQHSVYRFPSIAVALVVGLLPPRLHRGRMGRRWWLEGACPHDRSQDVDWAIGAVHVIRAAALDGRPPYSERWFMYVEDLELCWWMREHGWQVRLEADVTVPHVGNAAGAQAWGSGRERRYWAASYDFIGLARGRRYARLWAAANVAGVILHWAGNRAAAVIGGPGRGARLYAANRMRAVLRLHLRALAKGPPPPEPDPPR